MAEFAWWNTTYPYRYKILENTTAEYPVSVNGTGKVKGSVLWGLLRNDSYVYSKTSDFGGKLAIANETNEKYWENETNRTGYQPKSMWDSYYLQVFHFGEGSGTGINDSTYNGYNGVAISGSTWNTTCKFGGCLIFSSSTGRIPLNSTWDSLIDTEDYTIEAWVKTDTFTGQHYIWNVRYVCSGGCKGSSIYVDNTNTIHFFAGTGQIDCANIICANNWYHVVAIRDGTNIELFVNGTSCGTATTDATLPFGANTQRYIGSYDGSSSDWNGLIDEFRFSQANRIYVSGNNYVRDQFYNGYGNLTSLGTEEFVYSNESEGRTAIEQGISNALSGATVLTDQQIYTRNLTNGQNLGRFDKVASYGSQRWAFNYKTGSENYTYMRNITPAFYVWENSDMTTADITDSVSNFISQTKK